LLALTAFLACLLGLLGVGVAAALGRFQSRQFPFGPCLAAGGIISLLAGEAALSAYKAFFFPQL
jgi:prepilin signal peptidase PulO-like enzyme (type II secretory pathway)